MNITFELYVPGSWDGISESHPGLSDALSDPYGLIFEDRMIDTDHGPTTVFEVEVDLSSSESVYRWGRILEHINDAGLDCTLEELS